MKRLNNILGIIVFFMLFISCNLFAADKIFDHSNTGFELIGGHSVAACENCHIDGQFDGTPRECVGCHSRNGRFSATPKPVTHILSSEQCESCHQPIIWAGAVLVDHSQVFGRCFQCHNNIVAPGQPQMHIPTSHLECNECHSDVAWLPAQFSHDNLTGQCVSCHDGIVAEGKVANHILSTNQCESCHTTESKWGSKKNKVDHTQVIGACVSCHINDKEADHITVQNQCDACHGTYFWDETFTVDHDFVMGTCSSCHNGVVAKGQESHPSMHMETGAIECDACHDTTTFMRGPL